jgi:hypothetical protein
MGFLSDFVGGFVGGFFEGMFYELERIRTRRRNIIIASIVIILSLITVFIVFVK